MATHSSVLAWRIPGTGEPGGLPSMVSHRVGHDCSDLAVAAEHIKGNYDCPHTKYLRLFDVLTCLYFLKTYIFINFFQIISTSKIYMNSLFH